jgi:hypothetical protein
MIWSPGFDRGGGGELAPTSPRREMRAAEEGWVGRIVNFDGAKEQGSKNRD